MFEFYYYKERDSAAYKGCSIKVWKEIYKLKIKFRDVNHTRALGAHDWGPRVQTLAGDAPCEGLLPEK